MKLIWIAASWIVVGVIGYSLYIVRMSPLVTHIEGDAQKPVVIALLAIFLAFVSGASVVTVALVRDKNSN
jgi:hypothetical protein